MSGQKDFSPWRAFIVAAVSLCCLFCSTYALSYGDVLLLNGDTLFPERFYRDIFRDGGTLALWLFPVPAYWADLALYALIRPLAGEVTSAVAGYAAVQLCLLALVLLYCLWPSMDTPGRKTAAPACCALAVFLLSSCEGVAFATARMSAMHGLTIVLTLFCVGLLLRLLPDEKQTGRAALFFAVLALAHASDAIVMLWFVIPAVLFLAWLVWKKELSRRRFLFLLCCIALGIIAGKTANALWKPPMVVEAQVHISLSRTLRAIPAMASNLSEVMGGSLLAVVLFAFTVLVVLFRPGAMPRYMVPLLAVVFACALSGTLANGHARISYVLPMLLFTPLLGVAALPALLPARFAFPLCFAALVCLAGFAVAGATRDYSPYYPPLAGCIDEVAERHTIRNGVGTFWEVNFAPLFAAREIPFTVSHPGHLTPYPFLSTKRFISDRYDLVILSDRSSSFGDLEKMLLHRNGQPVESFTCPGTGAHIYAYPEKGASLATYWDYVNDDGLLTATRKNRDATVWEGNVEIAPGLNVSGVGLRYRMNRIWILLHFSESPDVLKGRQVTVYAVADRAKPASRVAKKLLSDTGNTTMDALWLRLAWHSPETIGPENSVESPDGGTIVYLEGPSRDTHDLPLIILESGEYRKRIR